MGARHVLTQHAAHRIKTGIRERGSEGGSTRCCACAREQGFASAAAFRSARYIRALVRKLSLDKLPSQFASRPYAGGETHSIRNNPRNTSWAREQGAEYSETFERGCARGGSLEPPWASCCPLAAGQQRAVTAADSTGRESSNTGAAQAYAGSPEGATVGSRQRERQQREGHSRQQDRRELP